MAIDSNGIWTHRIGIANVAFAVRRNCFPSFESFVDKLYTHRIIYLLLTTWTACASLPWFLGSSASHIDLEQTCLSLAERETWMGFNLSALNISASPLNPLCSFPFTNRDHSLWLTLVCCMTNTLPFHRSLLGKKINPKIRLEVINYIYGKRFFEFLLIRPFPSPRIYLIKDTTALRRAFIYFCTVSRLIT